MSFMRQAFISGICLNALFRAHSVHFLSCKLSSTALKVKSNECRVKFELKIFQTFYNMKEIK
jgi:hypothetical protein